LAETGGADTQNVRTRIEAENRGVFLQRLLDRAMEIAAINTNETNRWLPSLKRLAGVALTLACLDIAALILNLHTSKAAGVTILWPSNGLLLGIMLCAPRRHWPAYLTVGFAIDIGVNLSLAFSLWASAYLAGCNMLEVGLAAVLLRRTISSDHHFFVDRRQMGKLFLYGVVLAPAVASAFAQFEVAGTVPLPLLASFKFWFTADALGIAVITPLYLSFRQRQKFSGRSRLEIAGLLALLTGATLLVFSQTRFPLLFILLLFLLLLGVRLRLAGSVLGLLIISVIGGYFTVAGIGPTMLIHNASDTLRNGALRLFIGVSLLVVCILDIVIAESERLQTDLRSSENRFRLLAEASNDVIVLTDLSGERHYVSPAVTAVLGWQPEELLKNDYRQLVHPDDVPKLVALMEGCREGRPVKTLAYRCQKKEGGYLWMEASMQLYRNSATGKPLGFVNVVRDISTRKAADEEMNLAFSMVATLAMEDSLTGIANRRQFDDTMDQELRRAMRDGSMLSLLMIDVDHFKTYNDLYGHVMGDACLCQVAAVAQSVMHRTSDLFARYGGEEFVAILPNTDSRGAQLVAEQIRSAVELCSLPHAGNLHNFVTVSIGCATQTLTPETVGNPLLQAADRALYEAKSAGRNRIEIAEMLPVTHD
jgi:diguanylate cyclase (GGDEF)-like protein/PAS domain S-box-containing protein